MTREVLLNLLGDLAIGDCMAQLAAFGTKMMVPSEPYFHPTVQRDLIRMVAGDGDAARALEAFLDRQPPTVVFSEQQLLHLARLVLLHADDRTPDGFADGALYDQWVTCLFGVTDLLDANLDIEDRDQRLAWELRQCGLNHHEDQAPITAIHQEIFREIWPATNAEQAARAEEAFERFTGMTLADYVTVGSAVQARLVSIERADQGIRAIAPETYFDGVLGESRWKPFFDLLARDAHALGEELAREDAVYGETTYGSLTLERFPLMELEPGIYIPISMTALQRRVTEGVFHLLAEAAEHDERDRRTYTAGFGDAFQQLVEATLRRGNEATGQPVPVQADVRYGSGPAAERRSVDVILGYEGHPVFVEVVSGPLRIGTLTRGDREDFDADLQRLVLGKAGQLHASIEHFISGDLVLEGFDPGTTRRIIPVIVTSHGFPHAEGIGDHIRSELAGAGYLQSDQIEPLAIVSAEELFFCEGAMEQGHSFISLLRGWKTSPFGDLPFKNHLVRLGAGRAPRSTHFTTKWAEASAAARTALFGGTHDPQEMLRRFEADQPDGDT